MRPLLITVWLLATVACTTDNGITKPSDAVVRGAPANLRYFHDPRTMLCFAGLSEVSSASVSQMQITHVPCTEEVMRLIAR